MVGPGTGVAPFRAFLRERQAVAAPGRNWLFFGHQRQNHDFFYRDELSAMRDGKLLTRLTLAWSRDGTEKIYVQDRMREVGPDLWSWLQDGAHFYICGDARGRHGQGRRDRACRHRRAARQARSPARRWPMSPGSRRPAGIRRTSIEGSCPFPHAEPALEALTTVVRPSRPSSARHLSLRRETAPGVAP